MVSKVQDQGQSSPALVLHPNVLPLILPEFQIASDFAGSEPWDEAFDFGRFIPVAKREVGGVLQPTVISRDLYNFNGPGRNFPMWFAVECEHRKLKDRVAYKMFNFPRSGGN